ncbi:hypothetical protein [Halocatena halophila]|uniref:hypothetical protein n=1 Tax=Halocatena halophila TaxID=2814576 RepID=UPI002ED501C8
MNQQPNTNDDSSIVNDTGTSEVLSNLLEDGIEKDDPDQLVGVIKTLVGELQVQYEANDDLRTAIERRDERLIHLETTVERLEREQKEYREMNERDKAEIRQDVTENKRATEQNEAHTDAVARKVANCDGREERTPLEQVVRLPDEILHKAKLTANQRRARTIAMELGGLATTVPKGKRLDSTTIKDQLQREYGSAHDQTVARVMAFLDRLGGDRTEVVHTGKGKAVIFDDWLAQRLKRAEQFTSEAVEGVLTNVVSITTRTAG